MTGSRIVRAPLPQVDDPAPYSALVVGAVQAMAQGSATEHQQRSLYEWIVKSAAGIGAQSFRSGDSHATAFMEGRRFVGAQLIALQALDLSKLQKG